jgi:type I pantothenate kinase
VTHVTDPGGLRPVTDAIAARVGSADGAVVTGLAGGVGSGKSEMAREFVQLLGDDHGLDATVVSSDGFLFPNARLDRLGLMDRKGFTESYDAMAITAFLAAVRAGRTVDIPVYDHFASDIVDATETIAPRDVIVFEGVNALQFAPDLDLGVYIDAAEPDMRRWYLQRVLALREEARQRHSPFFSAYEHLDEDEFVAAALAVWEAVNLRNLAECIEPTRAKADVIVTKGPDHSVASIEFR